MIDLNLYKDRLRDYVERVTRPSGKNMFVCPVCHSGTGKKHTGAFRINKDGISWICFAGKGAHLGKPHGDIYELYKQINGCTDAEAFEGIERMFGGPAAQNTQRAKPKPRQPEEPETDYSGKYAKWMSHITETDYHRGLSIETLQHFRCGYAAAWWHPSAEKENGWHPPATPRLIVPTSNYSYLARYVLPEDTLSDKDTPKMKVGKWHLFNEDALFATEGVCFVTEGEIDAMSIYDVGGNACAVGSASYADKFIDRLTQIRRRIQVPLIIALDDDGAGRAATDRLVNGLKKLNIEYFIYRPQGKYHDANDALTKDRSLLARAVNVTCIDDIKRNVYEDTNASYLQAFIDGVVESINTPCVSTGYKNLDSLLDGGLYEGLYVIGAITSIGKTTYCMQMCDQIAAGGMDCLVINMEMARNELMSKSISRHTYITAHEKYSGKKVVYANQIAKTARGVTDGKRYAGYSDEERALIISGIYQYGEYAKHIYIKEGMGDIGVKEIREAVDTHIKLTKRRPVVFIDYMQILAPYNERMTDKQNIDKTIIELKRISRDYKITVVVISSLNRAGYNDKVTLTSFKESGAIEYTADCLIGMYLEDAGSEGFDSTEEKQRDPRKIELQVLKNRNGAVGGTARYDYYPKFNYFMER